MIDVYKRYESIYMMVDNTLNELMERMVAEILMILTPYYNMQSNGHTLDHSQNVAYRAYWYAQVDGAGEFIGKEILIAGYIHDMFAHNREKHHYMAYEWAMTDLEFIEFCEQWNLDRTAIALAAKHHRASSPTPPNWWAYPVSHYIATADRVRGLEDGLITMVTWPNRSIEESAKHIYHKFNKEIGYAKVPPLGYKHCIKELEEVWEIAKSEHTALMALQETKKLLEADDGS